MILPKRSRPLAMLSQQHEPIARTINMHGGRVNKLLGDGVLAYFPPRAIANVVPVAVSLRIRRVVDSYMMKKQPSGRHDRRDLRVPELLRLGRGPPGPVQLRRLRLVGRDRVLPVSASAHRMS